MVESTRTDATQKHLAQIAGAFGRELQHFSEEVRDGRAAQYAHHLADGPMVPADRVYSLIARQLQETLTEMLLLMGRLDADAANAIEQGRADELARVRAFAQPRGPRGQHWDADEPLTTTQRRRREELGTLSPSTRERVQNGEAD